MTVVAPVFALSRPRGAALDYALAPHALALAIFALCAFSPAIFNDGDTFSHIATGNWIWAHHAIPRTDPFTFSVAGKPWTAHEWLSELLLALAYKAGGFIGVAGLTGAAAASAIFIIARAASRDLGGPALAIVGALALMLVAPGLLARPHILALPIVALWAQALFARGGRAPPLQLSLLMLPWVNLHGGFAFGLALIAPAALDAVLAAEPTRRISLARDWSIFALAAGVAALINPYGVEGLLFPVRLLGLRVLSQIGEWGPETFGRPNGLEATMLALVALAFLRPVRLTPVRLATLVGLLHLSLSHARHEMLLAVVAPMLLAKPIAQALPAPSAPSGFDRRWALAGLVAAILALVGVRSFSPPPSPAAFESVQRALAVVPADLKSKPVLNGYGFGGYLIFGGIKPYVDGRADMFGDEFLSNYNAIAGGDGDKLSALLSRYDIAWTMLAPNEGAVARMDATPGWRRLYASPSVVIHAKAP